MELYLTMSSTVRIDENVKQRLKMKSAESGISQYDLINEYVTRCLDEDEKKQLSFDEIKKMLSYDRKERDDSLDDIVGIATHEEPTDSVTVKKQYL